MTTRLWPLLLGFSIWALAFIALYAVQSLGCTWLWPETIHRLILVGIWLAATGLLAGTMLYLRAKPVVADRPIRRAGIAATAASIAATAITFFPTLFVSLCV